MSENVPVDLLITWNKWGQYISYALFAVGLLVIAFHLFRLMSITDKKDKYDYINAAEINLLWYASLFLIIGGVIYSNTLTAEIIWTWVFVRGFVSAMLGFIAGVIMQNVLKFYYPFYIEKRLKKLRYSPRVSPKSGKEMKLLSEEEEDVYLDEGMQAEEDAFSVDYDVWIDEESGYTKIEKYNGRLHALKCPSCNYQTLKVTKEEVVSQATTEQEGELKKQYQCGYCSHKETRMFTIAKIQGEMATAAE